MKVSRESFDFDVLQHNLEELAANTYSGRGLVVAQTVTGNTVHVSWITGRSPGSRNRIYAEDGTAIITQPFDQNQGVGDRKLTIYPVMDNVGDTHAVTNGSQTAAIMHQLRLHPTWKRDKIFKTALLPYEHEPDEPIYTSRISAITNTSDGEVSISRISRDTLLGTSEHAFWRANLIGIAAGICIHTYESDGNPPPTLRESPYPVPVGLDAQETLDLYHETLTQSSDNLVGIAVKEIDPQTGLKDYKLYNRHLDN